MKHTNHLVAVVVAVVVVVVVVVVIVVVVVVVVVTPGARIPAENVRARKATIGLTPTQSRDEANDKSIRETFCLLDQGSSVPSFFKREIKKGITT